MGRCGVIFGGIFQRFPGGTVGRARGAGTPGSSFNKPRTGPGLGAAGGRLGLNSLDSEKLGGLGPEALHSTRLHRHQ